jgi:pyrroline-5-carboxylate reductase
MSAKSVGFIGGGRVVQIILGGWEKTGRMPGDVVVSDSSAEVLERLKARHPEIRTAHCDNREPAKQDLVFAALHPPVMGGCLSEIKPCLRSDAVLFSLAPKLTVAKLAAVLGGFDRIVRVIPNAPSIIGAGFNPICFSGSLDPKERTEISALLGALGKCPEVEENKLEAYAILTAMGPTYLWFQFCELQAISESFGLSRQEAQTGTYEMISGAVTTFFESGLSADQVLDLIPVKPLGEDEATFKTAYHARLEGLYAKLKN